MENEEKYIKDFNDAYLFSENYPDLAKQLSVSMEHDSVFRAGFEQYQTDQYESRRPSWLQAKPHSMDNYDEPDKDKDIDLDRD